MFPVASGKSDKWNYSRFLPGSTFYPDATYPRVIAFVKSCMIHNVPADIIHIISIPWSNCRKCHPINNLLAVNLVPVFENFCTVVASCSIHFHILQCTAETYSWAQLNQRRVCTSVTRFWFSRAVIINSAGYRARFNENLACTFEEREDADVCERRLSGRHRLLRTAIELHLMQRSCHADWPNYWNINPSTAHRTFFRSWETRQSSDSSVFVNYSRRTPVLHCLPSSRVIYN